MINNREKYDLIYRYLSIKKVGTVQTNKVLSTLSEPIEPYYLERQLKLSLDTQQITAFDNQESILNKLDSAFDVRFLLLSDEHYPVELKKSLSTNTPPILSYIGNIDLLKKRKVGFSGSRKVSDKGIAITRDCVKQLSEKDICIISGYAAGVDFEAHYHAIECGGSTIIVLPEGINGFRIRREMKNVWDWERILVISEFKPNDTWMTNRAMQRNNTIIGLSDIMVVVEAGETGGSYDAGLKTLSMNKCLFVPQYEVIPESAAGNNTLILKGGFPIKKSAGILHANLTKMFELLDKSNKYELF
jgi:DNA processing protein